MWVGGEYGHRLEMDHVRHRPVQSASKIIATIDLTPQKADF